MQGEVVVRVYGGKNGFAAVLSKMCSPGTPQKFDAATAELANLAKQVGGRHRAVLCNAHGQPSPAGLLRTVTAWRAHCKLPRRTKPCPALHIGVFAGAAGTGAAGGASKWSAAQRQRSLGQHPSGEHSGVSAGQPAAGSGTRSKQQHGHPDFPQPLSTLGCCADSAAGG